MEAVAGTGAVFVGPAALTAPRIVPGTRSGQQSSGVIDGEPLTSAVGNHWNLLHLALSKLN